MSETTTMERFYLSQKGLNLPTIGPFGSVGEAETARLVLIEQGNADLDVMRVTTIRKVEVIEPGHLCPVCSHQINDHVTGLPCRPMDGPGAY